MTSFGVMCKEIGHLNQNCLLYLPAKYQGWATPWIGVISNFNDYSKWETAVLYSYVTFLCAHDVLKRLFVRVVALIYKIVSPHRKSSLGFFCNLLVIIMTVRLFVVNLVILESVDVLFWCVTHFTNYIIYLREIQT